MIQVTSELRDDLSALIALIKEKTGVELTDSGISDNLHVCTMRFPDMETAKPLRMKGLNDLGTIFIDAVNHFFVYVISDGFQDYSVWSSLYKNLICDYNGHLLNLCGSTNSINLYYTNIPSNSVYYSENDSTKQNITLSPLRLYGYYRDDADTKDMYGKTFVKNAYINYERKFQPGLKFVDKNGNEFITLGSYLLYKNN